MKYYATAALLAASAQAQQAYVKNEKGALKDAVQVMEGIIMGALDAEFQDIEHCIEDGEAIIKDAENAWQDFKKHDFHDITLGLKALGDALMKAKAALTDCKGIVHDFQKLEEMSVAFSNPASLTWHIGKDLIVHGVDIYHEVTAAVHAMESTPKKFYDFGFNIGKAGAQILVGQEPPEPETVPAPAWKAVYPHENREMVADIYQGFMEAAGVGTFNFTNLLLCIYEADQSALALYEGVNLLEEAWQKKEWQEAIGGAIFIVSGVQSFEQQALPVCEQIDSSHYDFSQLEKMNSLFKNKETTMKVIGENLVFNGVTITAEFVWAMEAYEAKEYKKFGTLLGNALVAATAQDKNMYIF